MRPQPLPRRRRRPSPLGALIAVFGVVAAVFIYLAAYLGFIALIVFVVVEVLKKTGVIH